MAWILCACAQSDVAAILNIEIEHDANGSGDGRIASLPLHQRTARRGDSIYWYKIPTAAYKTLDKPALLISRAGTNFQIHMDDKWQFGGSFDRSPMNYTWNTPFLIPLSKQTLTQSEHIRIGIYALAGSLVLLEPPRIGEYEALTDLHQAISWRQNKLAFTTTLVAICLGLISLMLWVSSQRQRQYLFGFLSAMALVAATLNFFVLHPWLEQNFWQALVHMSLDWFCVFSVQWIAALKGLDKPWIHRLWLWGVASSAINLLLPVNYVSPTVELLHLVSIAILLAALLAPFNTEDVDPFERRVLLMTGISGSLMCSLDLLIQLGLLQAPGLPRLVPLAFFITLVFYHIVLCKPIGMPDDQIKNSRRWSTKKKHN